MAGAKWIKSKKTTLDQRLPQHDFKSIGLRSAQFQIIEVLQLFMGTLSCWISKVSVFEMFLLWTRTSRIWSKADSTLDLGNMNFILWHCLIWILLLNNGANTLIYFSKKMAKIVSSQNGTKFHQIWMIPTMEGFTRSEKLVKGHKGHKGFSTSQIWEKIEFS